LPYRIHRRIESRAYGDAARAAAAVVAVYDGVSVQLLLDGDAAAARAWLRDLLTALLTAPTPTDTVHGR
jgi:hypothetical protein